VYVGFFRIFITNEIEKKRKQILPESSLRLPSGDNFQHGNSVGSISLPPDSELQGCSCRLDRHIELSSFGFHHHSSANTLSQICKYLDKLLLDHHHHYFKYLAPWMELPMGGIACSGASFRLRRRIRQMAALARIHWNGRSAVRRKRFLFALFGHVPDPRSTVGGTL